MVSRLLRYLNNPEKRRGVKKIQKRIENSERIFEVVVVVVSVLVDVFLL